MSILNELETQHWNRVIGDLPDGFYLRARDNILNLYYNGPGFHDITQPGGKKPEANEDCAHVTSIFTDYGKEEIIGFIIAQTKKVQQQVAEQSARQKP